MTPGYTVYMLVHRSITRFCTLVVKEFLILRMYRFTQKNAGLKSKPILTIGKNIPWVDLTQQLGQMVLTQTVGLIF